MVEHLVSDCEPRHALANRLNRACSLLADPGRENWVFQIPASAKHGIPAGETEGMHPQAHFTRPPASRHPSRQFAKPRDPRSCEIEPRAPSLAPVYVETLSALGLLLRGVLPEVDASVMANMSA